MTKIEMQKRIDDLEETLAAAGVKVKSTKMDEIEELETDTMVKVRELIGYCENITGRKLKEVNSVDFSDAVKASATPLRSMVEEMCELAMGSGRYSFPSENAFANWVKTKIMERT